MALERQLRSDKLSLVLSSRVTPYSVVSRVSLVKSSVCEMPELLITFGIRLVVG